MKFVTQLFQKFFILLLTSSISFYILSCTGGSTGPTGGDISDPAAPSTTIANAQTPPPQSSSTWTPVGNSRRVMVELSLGPDGKELECNKNHLPQTSFWVKENADWQLLDQIENNFSPNSDETTHYCQKFMSSLAYFSNKAECDNSLLKFKVIFKNNDLLYEGESRDISCAEREIRSVLLLSIELFSTLERSDLPSHQKDEKEAPNIFQKPALQTLPAKK